MDPEGGASSDYYLALARLNLQIRDLEGASNSLEEALKIDHQVALLLVEKSLDL